MKDACERIVVVFSRSQRRCRESNVHMLSSWSVIQLTALQRLTNSQTSILWHWWAHHEAVNDLRAARFIFRIDHNLFSFKRDDQVDHASRTTCRSLACCRLNEKKFKTSIESLLKCQRVHNSRLRLIVSSLIESISFEISSSLLRCLCLFLNAFHDIRMTNDVALWISN